MAGGHWGCLSPKRYFCLLKWRYLRKHGLGNNSQTRQGHERGKNEPRKVISNESTEMRRKTQSFNHNCGRSVAQLLGLFVTLCLTFKGTAKMFSKMAVPFTFPWAMCEGSNFTTFSSTLFDSSHSSTYEVLFHSGFDLNFPYVWWCWASFHVVCHLYVFLEKKFILILYLFLAGSVRVLSVI